MARWVAGIGMATILLAWGFLATTAAPQAKSRPVAITGRIVDNICMLGAGLKGDEHRECAGECSGQVRGSGGEGHGPRSSRVHPRLRASHHRRDASRFPFTAKSLRPRSKRAI